ncbi:CpaF family protein [Arenibaculum sp.]|uniref:CpaF family protein n=1 Tax=Arenibaculum sp. TaxID=2865862 RepID=UPI002E144F78|nr:CpaF family protein [Arenibaculum sp.]
MFGRRTSPPRPPSRHPPPLPPPAAVAPETGNASPGGEALAHRLADAAASRLGAGAGALARGKLAEAVEATARDLLAPEWQALDDLARRDAVTYAVEALHRPARPQTDARPPAEARPGPSPVEQAKEVVQPLLLERMDLSVASALPRGELARQVGDIVAEIAGEKRLQLNGMEQRDLVTVLLNDMLGLGPLEPLLADETVTDIMVNGPRQVYVERRGKLEATGIVFRDDAHVMNVAQRIVSRVGRRVDESVPLADARLPDGSRVNIIIPPLAIDGPTISIRKFSKKKITIEVMERQNNLSPQMATVLRIACRARLNILISGGTGSGKTTLLNALSRMIDTGERVVTIEDAAELQLQQPHVVRLETRPPNLEGEGEITQRELVRNALRMRPDRIILGEIRGGEALDMLQAMNTGHDGSMGTVHANNPREALTRLENMVAMTGVRLPSEAVRAQIAAAVNMVIQISRMRDGVRRITRVTEVVGREGDVITTQDLFHYEFQGEDADGRLRGTFRSTGLRPFFTPRAEYYGLDRSLLEAME